MQNMNDMCEKYESYLGVVQMNSAQISMAAERHSRIGMGQAVRTG